MPADREVSRRLLLQLLQSIEADHLQHGRGRPGDDMIFDRWADPHGNTMLTWGHLRALASSPQDD